MGLSAWGMALTAASVTSIDTFKANSAGQQQMEQITTLNDYLNAISRYRNVTYHIGASEGLSPIMEGRLFDMVFLDAMHDYENVKADIERWWPKVIRGGIMAFHDYGHHDFPGVKRAVDERFGLITENVVITLAWLQRT